MDSLKKRFALISIMVFSIVIASILTFFATSGQYPEALGISGMISSEIDVTSKGISVQMIFLVVLWFIALVISLASLRKYIKIIHSDEVNVTYYKIKNSHEKSNTDLDALYSILKEHKSLKIKDIARTFKITKERAFEWAKILEESDLAMVEYPAFSEPLLEIKIKNVEEKNETA